MAMSKWLSVPCFIAWTLFNMLLLIFVAAPLAVLVFIITIVGLPYTLHYYSSNWGMNKKYMPPVQLYLDHFESLHPELIASVAEAHKLTTGEPPGIRFWPVHDYDRVFIQIPFVATYTIREWTFSQAAGLFGRLEASGVADRRALWKFLRDEVERAGLVNETEKEAFMEVMTVMNSHRLETLILKLNCDGKRSAGHTRESAAPPGRRVPVGMDVVLVGKDSVEWILRRGAFLVPEKSVLMGRLAEFKLWGEVRKDADVEKGLGSHWQVFDSRQGYPWEEWM
jgi:hypothetical protein